MGVSALLPREARRFVAQFRPYVPYGLPTEASYGAEDPWAFLRDLDAVPQRGIIAGYIQHLAPAGRVLDVGCGEGLLLRSLGPGVRYTGVDVSGEAIARARRDFDDRAIFHEADATLFEPDGEFDIIVFNESLYYMPDPAGVVRRYERFLAPEGHIIVSMYEAQLTMRAWNAIGRGRTPKHSVSLTRADKTRWEIRLY